MPFSNRQFEHHHIFFSLIKNVYNFKFKLKFSILKLLY